MAANINEIIGNSKDRICACGGKFFGEALALKEVSPLYSKSGKYETMILKIGFVCLGCGKFMSLRPKDPEETKSEVVLTDKGDGKEV